MRTDTNGPPGTSQGRGKRSFAPPALRYLILLMFMTIMSGSTPLMQGVVEEKMQRIAEVLLGSVAPFPLMLGKLIGLAGVVGVAATGIVVVRSQRRRAAYTPEQVRQRLHERLTAGGTD